MILITILAIFGAVSADIVCPPSSGDSGPMTPNNFPNPNDCSSFYACSNGSPHLLQCPAGLHWNEAHKRCDYPANANCSVSEKLPEIAITVPAQPESAELEASKEQEVPDSCPAEDPADPTHPIHLPHPTNCSLFYKCWKGVPYLHQCPEGLHWNVEKDYCDYPANANCSVSGKLPEIAIPVPAEPDSAELEASKEQEVPDSCPAEDPADPTHPIHLPHPTDCSLFYKCWKGVPYLHQCPEELHWNVEKDYCDYPANANCSVSGKLPEIAIPVPAEADSAELEASKEQEVPDSCPAEDPEDPTHPIHLPHPTDCSLFYKCWKGVPYLHQCPEGLHWNVEKDYCDYPAQAKCET